MNKLLIQFGAIATTLSMASCSLLKKEVADHVDINETDSAIVLDVSAGKAIGKNDATISVKLDIDKDTVPDYIAHFIAPKSQKEQEVLEKLLKKGEEVALKEVIKKAHHIHKVVPPQASLIQHRSNNMAAYIQDQKVNVNG